MGHSDKVSAILLCFLSNVCKSSLNYSFAEDAMIKESPPTIIIVTVFIESVYSLIGLFCIVANIINCFVFYRQGLQDRMNLSLFALALAELGFVFSYSFLGIALVLGERQLHSSGQSFYEHHQRYFSFLWGINFAFRTTSGLYIMVIAIDRCVCVLFPLKAASLITSSTMAKILGFFGVLCQLGFICQPLKYDVIETKVEGISEWQHTPSKFYLHNKVVIDIIVYTIFSVSVPLVTFVIVSLATLITVIQLTSAAAWRRKTSSTSVHHNSQQVALTYMLVLASCVFIVSMIPFALVKIVRLLVEEFSVYGAYRKLYEVCTNLANGSPVINSFVTFFIYYSRSSRYRNELKKLCGLVNR